MAKVERWNCGARLCLVVATDNMVKTAGVVANDTSLDVAGQTQNILDQIDDLLVVAGARKRDITDVAIWLAHIGNDFAIFNEVYDQWVDHKNLPVRATVGSPLATPDYLVEIQVSAWRD
eukprot:CAMPEP_0205821452 /NCGR_PEP_ID=MMETSP0206-20130828/7589_1 /ASSEMBLY_ACC=CAM_ASM_000279 /TAXON_ID=36767 /ORGANISM="Euplotes focardii, Strain TN1" /LENGTH=118 /DNA_ID=CAMNT_0053116939 /DNA_START=79 /DNA_END=435 /DNA_ORIENTATION=+